MYMYMYICMRRYIHTFMYVRDHGTKQRLCYGASSQELRLMVFPEGKETTKAGPTAQRGLRRSGSTGALGGPGYL